MNEQLTNLLHAVGLQCLQYKLICCV